jgi:hypothetical protein
MFSTVRILTLTTVAISALLAGCASAPPPAAPATAAMPATGPAETQSPVGQTKYKWSKATEAEVAAALDRKFEAAAKQFVQLKRNDQLMVCKRYREMGSSIRTLHCITEAELRKQVEDSDQMRDQMRQKVGKCTMGDKVPCSAGF